MPDLYANQHVLVGPSGLHEASNLIARMGSLEAVMRSCEGWWIGLVEKVIREDGSEEVPLDLTLHSLKRQGLDAMGKGRKKKKSDDGKDGACPPPSPKGTQVGQRGEPMEVDSNGAGPVIKARVRWLGSKNPRARDQLACMGRLPMVPLEVTDTISREYILYEQRKPQDIKWTIKRVLYAHSLRGIIDHLPKGLTSSTFTGQQQGQEGGPTVVTMGYNHAGVHVGTNLPALGEEEEKRWRATQEEVCGFKWSLPPQGDDPAPPVYEVVGLRRDSNGLMFGVVETSDGDYQLDHRLPVLRKRMFEHAMNALRDHTKASLPLMMQWRKIRSSTLILDPYIIAANATYYEMVTG